MKFNFFGSNELTPEQEKINKSRSEYVKNAGKRAKQQNSFKEKIIGGDTAITKDEVIESDAHLEDRARGFLKAGDMSEKEFDQLINNSLIFSHYESPLRGIDHKVESRIEGEINDQDVKLKISGKNGYDHFNYIHDYDIKYSGTINGNPLTEADARALYDKCAAIVATRDQGVYGLKEKKIADKNLKYYQKLEDKERKKVDKIRNLNAEKKSKTEVDLGKVI